MNRQTDRQTDRRTGRQQVRYIIGQTDSRVGIYNRQAGKCMEISRLVRGL